jgi:nucleotide-binding universal stress UspA family protein
MIAIKKILCPVDGSEFSLRALEHAVALARWYEAGISILSVASAVPATPDPTGREGYVPLAPGERDRIVGWLQDLADTTRARGVPVDFRVIEGLAVKGILQEASELPADLVVMGTHGRSGFDRLALGSVTERVLRRATCPVLTVSQRTVPAHPSGRPPFESIVCPVDFSPASQRAIEYSLSLAQEAYGRLILMHAVEQFSLEENLSLARFDVGAFHQAVEQAAAARLAGILPVGVRDWCKPECVVSRGKAYQAILNLAEERAADLIVIGVHGRNPLDLAIFGSTTHHVVREAHCPVLVVRS